MEKRIFTECCMKQTVKTLAKRLINKPLTDREAGVLCLYHFLISLTLWLGLIQLQMVARGLNWLFADILSTNAFRMLVVFINIMLTIEMIEIIIDITRALFCKCDYRTHPELENNTEYYI
jgi:hypothetical protein